MSLAVGDILKKSDFDGGEGERGPSNLPEFEVSSRTVPHARDVRTHIYTPRLHFVCFILDRKGAEFQPNAAAIKERSNRTPRQLNNKIFRD